jgi:RNA polymerase sigma-70 factor (ECF subfamily)
LFVRLFSASERSLRAFLYNLLPGSEEVDEVMQQVSLVLWKKFDQFDPDTEFLRWGYVVARYEGLMFRRKKARDRHVFGDELINLMADEYEGEAKPLRAERRALDHCLSLLKDADRQLLMACYAQGTKINEIAGRLGLPRSSLYKKLNRFRVDLLKCIKRNPECLKS